MSKVILISFADKRFRNALKRVEEYTINFPFDERYFLTPDNSMTKKFWKDLKPWLYRRGYGYWVWKSHIVKEYLDKLEDGDILFYCDAGVYWYDAPKALKRFDDYLKILKDDSDILAFQQPTIEQEWTKGDILEALNVYGKDEICKSNQLWSGCFGLKKTKLICDFVNKWMELSDIKMELVTDKRSDKPNKTGFKENRHDQSIFSVLVKLYPHKEISYLEVDPPDKNWDTLSTMPIQGRRHKEKDRPLSVIIKNKLLRPWREIMNIYFRRFRDYEFLTKRSYPW